jgi:hypothetical protein
MESGSRPTVARALRCATQQMGRRSATFPTWARPRRGGRSCAAGSSSFWLSRKASLKSSPRNRASRSPRRAARSPMAPVTWRARADRHAFHQHPPRQSHQALHCLRSGRQMDNRPRRPGGQPGGAKALLDKLIAEAPFEIHGVQVDGGSEFKSCSRRNVRRAASSSSSCRPSAQTSTAASNAHMR